MQLMGSPSHLVLALLVALVLALGALAPCKEIMDTFQIAHKMSAALSKNLDNPEMVSSHLRRTCTPRRGRTFRACMSS